MGKKLKASPVNNQRRLVTMKLLIVTCGAVFSFLCGHLIQNYQIVSRLTVEEINETSTVINESSTSSTGMTSEPRPKYWFYMARGYMWIFFSVDNVLQKLGLEKIEIQIEGRKFIHNDWDLLWSYDYHTEIPINFKELRYNQKINHIPGNYVLCMKDNLAVNTDSKYIPKAFNNTDDLLKYVESHPKARFVQKLWSNRGVELKEASEINFKLFGPGYKYFAQLYVENPLLIDGLKFDFGIYVLVTSIDPLRVYYYGKNTLIRTCVKKYDRDNYDNVDTYVIGDSCLFPWDIDALSIYYNNSYTYKEAMNAYFTEKGYDMNSVWLQVEDCIREIVLSKEDSFKYWLKGHNFKYSFFELYRFDFMLDGDLKLHLIEVNQSPNINPSEKLYRDRRMFESVLFDSFNLLGVGHYMKKQNFELGPEFEEHMICHDENLNVKPHNCVTYPCNATCTDPVCRHCWKCLSQNKRYELHLAYRETKNRGSMRRVFPPSQVDVEKLGNDYLETLSPANRLHTEWFIEMCKNDPDFCR